MASTMARPSPEAPSPRASSSRVKRSKASGQDVRREAVALVGDVQLDAPVVFVRPQTHRSGSVTQCVVDEIAERLLEPQEVAGERDRVGLHLERAALGSRPLVEAAGDRLEELACGNRRGAQRQSSLVEACQDQQVLGEPREPVDLVPADRRASSSSPGVRLWRRASSSSV